MPDGGFVDIFLENHHAGSDDLLPLPLPLPGTRYVRLAVQDHGAGISKKHQDRVFDPYFTTKEAGNGLGLAICFSIVNKHGGYLTLESEPGRGTTFYVYLAAVDFVESRSKQSGREQPALQTGSGHRVLVMDDEEIVCSVVSRMLEILGYETETSSDGEGAIRLYSQALDEGTGYAVVIMDLTIPGGMGGVEAVGRLLAIDPAARVIVSSGYSSHEVMANYKKYGFAGVVAKPFRFSDLGRVLKEVLEG